MNVRNIPQKFLIDCLKGFLKDVKVRGRFRIYFTGMQVKDEQAFGDILKLVLKTGCFDPFQMKMQFSQILFHVVKTKVLEVVDGLAWN